MSALPDFAPCSDRIERAESKANALIKEWKAFHEANRYQSFFKNYGNGRYGYFIKIAELPKRFSLEFGEVLYQIRAALDNAVYACCLSDNGGNLSPDEEKNIGFPVYTKINDFKSKIGQMCLDRKRIRILRAIQPYHAVHDLIEIHIRCYWRAFYILNEWAKIDRHRRLHLIGVALCGGKTDFTFDRSIQGYYIPMTGVAVLKNETEIGQIIIIDPDGTPLKMNTNSSFDIDIGIDEPPAFMTPDDMLTGRLNTILEAARAVIQALEESYR